MIDFNKIAIDKNTLKHNDKVFCVDISGYNEYNMSATPFLATVKISDNFDLYFDDEEDKCLYSDHEKYIVIKILEDGDNL